MANQFINRNNSEQIPTNISVWKSLEANNLRCNVLSVQSINGYTGPGTILPPLGDDNSILTVENGDITWSNDVTINTANQLTLENGSVFINNAQTSDFNEKVDFYNNITLHNSSVSIAQGSEVFFGPSTINLGTGSDLVLSDTTYSVEGATGSIASSVINGTNVKMIFSGAAHQLTVPNISFTNSGPNNKLSFYQTGALDFEVFVKLYNQPGSVQMTETCSAVYSKIGQLCTITLNHYHPQFNTGSMLYYNGSYVLSNEQSPYVLPSFLKPSVLVSAPCPVIVGGLTQKDMGIIHVDSEYIYIYRSAQKNVTFEFPQYTNVENGWGLNDPNQFPNTYIAGITISYVTQS